MPQIALAVELSIHPEHRDDFEAELKDHAAKTLGGEEGCIQFDVHISRENPNLFFIYEVYADTDALATHRANPQLPRYQAITQHMVIERQLKEWEVLLD